MREVGTFEAKNTLSSLLDRVEEGEEIAITRHGKRVARLVKDTGDPDRQARARQAAEDILRLSRGLTLGGLSIRSLRDEGAPLSLVLDCSVTVAWFFEDEQDAAALRVLDRVLVEGATVPGIWRYEVAHVLLRAERRKRLASRDRDTFLARLSALDIQVDPDWARNLWTSTIRLAQQHGLSVYGASYLELAQRLRSPLATSDKAMKRAASAERVELA